MGYLLAAFMSGLFMASDHPAATSRVDRVATPLKPGVFLLAVPELRDPNFAKTVVLLVNYGNGGAMGVIVNKPTDVTVEKALPDVEGMKGQTRPVFFGGPVSRNLLSVLLRSTTPPKGAQKVFDGIHFAGNREALVEALQNRDPNNKVRVYAGYSGWSPGQLDREVSRGDWVITDADSEMIFANDPSKVWPEILRAQERLEVRGPLLNIALDSRP